MNLYDRDYTSLTQGEEAEWQSLRSREVVGKIGNGEIRRSNYREYPKAARHFTSLFPNNFLDVVELQDELRLGSLFESFDKLLNSGALSERNILNFINKEGAYFIVASLLKEYFNFGHHDAYIFPEFQLGNSHVVDYLLVGKSSDGWQFVLVELESVVGNITLANGDLGSSFRKGLTQLADWKSWIEARYSSFSETFNKLRQADKQLPPEFTQLDTSRFHYVVIAGRRTDFKEKTYQIRRKCQKESSELILHYDNLSDAAKRIIGQATY